MTKAKSNQLIATAINDFATAVNGGQSVKKALQDFNFIIEQSFGFENAFTATAQLEKVTKHLKIKPRSGITYDQIIDGLKAIKN